MSTGGLVVNRRRVIRSVAALAAVAMLAGCAAKKSYQEGQREMRRQNYDQAVLAYSKAVAADLRRIYSAPTAEAAEAKLDAFEEKWAGKYASIALAWRRAWAEVVPFFAFDPAIRKIIYTTNAIESRKRLIRKSIKTRGSFSTDEAATKLIYLAIRNFEKDGRNVREWCAVFCFVCS